MAPIPSIASLSSTLSSTITTNILSLTRRQQATTPDTATTPIVAIPNTLPDKDNSTSPGAVVGIVLGSVFGLLLVLWLLATCFGLGPSYGGGGSSSESSISVREHRSSSHRQSTRRRSRSYSPPRRRSVDVVREVREVHRSPRREPRRETVVVDVEERRRSRDDERGSDVVEVFEERSGGRRNSGRRPSTGYREVDANLYAGGNRPVEQVFVRKGSRKGRR